MNNKNVRNTKNKNKFVKLVIGLSIGLILLTGTTFVLAREMPKYDKNLNTWDKIIYSLKGGWEAVFNPGVKHNSQYKRVEEKKNIITDLINLKKILNIFNLMDLMVKILIEHGESY